MDEQKIRQIAKQVAQEEMRSFNSNSRFGQSPIQRHIHNNIDSPFVFQPILTYIGAINSTGVPSLLPKGWTSTLITAAGPSYAYQITHNLASNSGSTTGGFSSFYSVVASSQRIDIPVTVLVAERKDDFFVAFANLAGGSETASFTFILTVVNNRNTQLPVYSGTLIK